MVKMKTCLLLMGFLVGVSATSALAAGPYLGASGGIAIPHDSDIDISGVGSGKLSYNVGGGFNVAGGYNFDPVRLEFEFGYKAADVDKVSGAGGSAALNGSDINVKSYMVNGYWDIKTATQVTPFVGVGLGVVDGEINLEGVKADDSEFGYQFTVGAGFKVAPQVNLDLAYRYQGAASDFTKNGVSVSYGSSNIIAGIRYNF
jgi:outer membrane immunogenic protein